MLMSLRFTAIVFEELRNVSLGLIARGIDWSAIGWKGIIGLLGALISRMIDSLFNSSGAISDAIISRGYLKATKQQPESLEATETRDVLLNLASLLLLCTFAVIFEA
jgi:general transcription factor 3C polypeptide 2